MGIAGCYRGNFNRMILITELFSVIMVIHMWQLTIFNDWK